MCVYSITTALADIEWFILKCIKNPDVIISHRGSFKTKSEYCFISYLPFLLRLFYPLWLMMNI